MVGVREWLMVGRESRPPCLAPAGHIVTSLPLTPGSGEGLLRYGFAQECHNTPWSGGIIV